MNIQDRKLLELSTSNTQNVIKKDCASIDYKTLIKNGITYDFKIKRSDNIESDNK